MRGMISRPYLERLAKFGAVGGTVFIMGNALLVFLVERTDIGVHAAAAIQLALSILVNYDLSRRFVWHDRHVDRATLAKFIGSRGVSALMAWIIFTLLVATGVHYLIANIAGVLISMGANFALSDRWVFGKLLVQEEEARLAELTLTWRDALLVVIGTGVFFSMLWIFAPELLFSLVLVTFAVIATGMALFHVVSVLYPHKHESQYEQLRLPDHDGKSAHSIAILIPARHEEIVLPVTIARAAWGQRLHQSHTILVIVNDDDPQTEHVARKAGDAVNAHLKSVGSYDELEALIHTNTPLTDLTQDSGDPVVEVLVYPLEKQSPSKPKQLNYAFGLLHERYDAFTILDAESIAADDLLLYVDQALRDHPGIDIFQGGIQLMPLGLPEGKKGYFRRLHRDVTKWYSWHNILEYYRWFSGQMMFQSDIGFMPLGGNTVFIRTELLRATDGWPDELTEDCALGVRASALHNAETLAFYMPELATKEEPPDSLSGFVKQRVRWNQGFLQTLIKGLWRILPGSWRRALALTVLSVSFFQACMAVLVPVTLVTMVAVKSPPPLVLVMFLPFLLVVLTICLQVVHLHEFGKRYGVRIDPHMYVWLPVTNFPYQLLLSYCAARAVVRHFRGDTTWAKTTHKGHHLQLAAPQAKGSVA